MLSIKKIKREMDERFQFQDSDTRYDAQRLIDLKFRAGWRPGDIVWAVLLGIFAALWAGIIVSIFCHLDIPLIFQVIIIGGFGFLLMEVQNIRQRIKKARKELHDLLASRPDYWHPLLAAVEKIILNIRRAENVSR